MSTDDLSINKFLQNLKTNTLDSVLNIYMKRRKEIVKQLEIEEIQDRIKAKIIGTTRDELLPIGFDEEYIDDSDIDEIEYGNCYLEQINEKFAKMGRNKRVNEDFNMEDDGHKDNSDGYNDGDYKNNGDEYINNDEGYNEEDDEITDKGDLNVSDVGKSNPKTEKTRKNKTMSPFIDLEAEISGSDPEDSTSEDIDSKNDSDLSDIIDENAPEYAPTIPIIHEDKELEFMKRKYELGYQKKKTRKQKIYLEESSDESGEDSFELEQYSSDFIEEDEESQSSSFEYVDVVKPSGNTKQKNDISFDK